MASSTNNDLTNSTSEALLSLLADGDQGIVDRCALEYVLGQLIALFKHTLDNEQYEKRVWLTDIEEAVVAMASDSPIVDHAARIIVTTIEQAPWILENGEWLSCVNAISFAMKRAVQVIQGDLKQAEDDGIHLRDYRDLADFTKLEPEGEDDAEEDGTTKVRSKEPSITSKRGPGHRTTGPGRIWDDAEVLHLLKITRDNLDKRWDDRVRAHNDSYIVPTETKLKHPRTKEGIRQKLLQEVGLTVEGMKERLENEITEREGQQDEE